MGNLILILIMIATIIYLIKNIKKVIENIEKNNYEKNEPKKTKIKYGKITTTYKKNNTIKSYTQGNTTTIYTNENTKNYNTTIKGYESQYKQERKKAFEENRKKRYREFMKKNKEKGKEFELYTGQQYQNLGYTVSYNGIGKNKKDKGIDLIAKNKNEILLIQCKNWKSKKITHKELKEFIGNCVIYKEKNLKKESKNIKYIFVTSNYILDKSAEYFIKDNQDILEYKVIQYNN